MTISCASSAPIIILTTPDQKLYNLTDLLDVVPPGSTLPLSDKGDLLTVVRPQAKTLSRSATSSSTISSEVVDNEWPIPGNVVKSSQILKRTKASDSLIDGFISNEVTKRQQIKRQHQSEPLITITAHVTDISGAADSFSTPSAASSLALPTLSRKYSISTDCQPRIASQVSLSDSSDPLSCNSYQIYHSGRLKTWELTYTPSRLKQQQTDFVLPLHPVSIHKKRGTLSVMTVLRIINELNRSAVQLDGFYLCIPRYYEQIEVQFRLLMIRNGWDTWLISYQKEMHNWPLTKKWLLIHQYELLAWLKKQCNIGAVPSPKMTVSSGVNSLNRINLPASVGKKVSSKPVRTAYYYILRDLAHNLSKKLI